MRRNRNSLPIFLSVITTLSLVFSIYRPAYAGAPQLEGCTDNQGRHVPTQTDPRLESFAKVKITRSSTEDFYTILVNPTHYYLSRETQQWLYFRQCAHIKLNHQSIRVKDESQNLREERDADCWAIMEMLQNEQFNFRERQIAKIKKDIELLERERERWQDVFGAPRRNTYTYECLQSDYKK